MTEDEVREIIQNCTDGRFLGIFGEETVNVLEVNLMLVGEPTEDDAMAILFGLRDRYEAFHKARITDDAVRAAVKLSARYISDRYLPDKAIDVMDEAAARVRMKVYAPSHELQDLEQKLADINKEKEAALAGEDFEKCASLRDAGKKVSSEISALQIHSCVPTHRTSRGVRKKHPL